MNVANDKNFQLLVFDWDGTLADSEACIIDAMQLASTEAELPKRNDAQIRDVIGLSLDVAIETLAAQAPTDQQLEQSDSCLTAQTTFTASWQCQVLSISPRRRTSSRSPKS